MKAVRERAWAKLNLMLDVLEPRADGYHEMDMFMQSCTLCDEVRVTLTRGEFSAHSNLYYLPGDERNIAVRAARLFLETIGERRLGARIDMKKRIPVCAGMGGGSSDAAAVLRALNRLTGAGLPARRLREIGLALGADVPFCITGGACRAGGRGELLRPVTGLPDCGIVIIKPRFSISTPELFRRIDARVKSDPPALDEFCAALEAGELRRAAPLMRNVFEDVLPPEQRGIFDIKARLMAAGALGSLMTGTGSAVFGLFETEAAAEKAAGELCSGGYAVCCTARPARELHIG